MPEPIVVAADLRKRYGDRVAVDGVSFTVAAGEAYGLLGPNGAGKTTAISMVCGLLSRDGGTVTVAGRSMDGDAVEAKSFVGYVPQDLALYPDLSARENLDFWGKLYGLGGPRLRDRAAKVLDIVGLSDRAKDRVSDFSGGMKRRLNIGAALLHEPKVLVLDEPTVGVDPQTRNAIFETVETMKRSGLALLYTTHYMEEAERLCDRVGIIDEGKIIAEGSRRELVAKIGERDRVQVSATGDLQALAAALRTVGGVESATVAGDGIVLVCQGGRGILPRIVDATDRSGAALPSVEVVEPELEAVFLHLTGKALRD
ncbi:MAG: ABC transporter ATP-binding protein [Candidatus Limnocylindria bacterium]